MSPDLQGIREERPHRAPKPQLHWAPQTTAPSVDAAHGPMHTVRPQVRARMLNCWDRKALGPHRETERERHPAPPTRPAGSPCSPHSHAGHRGAAGRPCHTTQGPAKPWGPRPSPSSQNLAPGTTTSLTTSLHPASFPQDLSQPARCVACVRHPPRAAQGRAPHEGEGSPWPGPMAQGRPPRAPPSLPRPLSLCIAYGAQLSTWPRWAQGENRTPGTMGKSRSTHTLQRHIPRRHPPPHDRASR